MARIRRLLAFLLILTICFSLGEGLAFASDGSDEEPVSAAVHDEGGEEESPDPSEFEEPEATEPEAVEPEATEPETTAPETTASEATAPETTAPEATAPETTAPEAAAPEAVAPETTAPEAVAPETAEPEATEPETGEPETTEPETGEPETTEPEAGEPEATEPGTMEPDVTEPEPEVTEEPQPKQWPWTEPGNTVAAILNGGRTLVDGDATYRSEDGLWVNDTFLSGADAANLNLSDGMLYYSVGSAICRIPASGGADQTVHTASETVEQMYVMGQEIRFLAGHAVYSYDMRDGMVEQLTAPDGVVGLAPTKYGNLFLTGEKGNYTLYAGQLQVLTGVESCDTDGEWLIVITGGASCRTSLSALFAGSVDLQAYDADLTMEGDTPATPEVSEEPEATPEASEEPEATPEASEEPEASPAVSEEPEATPEASEEPEASPEVSEEPEASPEVSEEPEATPEVSEEPEATPEASEEPEASPEVSEEPETTPETSEEPEASPEASGEPVHKQWPWTEPGATAASILSGGRYLTANGITYASEGGLWAGDTYLADADGENLNLSGGMLYYSTGSTICRIPASGGTAEVVYTADAAVAQMYVMGQEIRFLAGGAVYSYDMRDSMAEQLTAPDGVIGLIPTQYGNLYLTGDYFNYTLWAEQIQLRSGIDSCRPDGEWLVVVTGGETYQTSLSALFEGSIHLQAYSLHQGSVNGSGLSDEQQLANEAAYLQSDAYAALAEGLTEYGSNGIMTVSTSHVRSKSLTANQQNIVLRAQQMADVTWKCLADRYSWGGNDGSYTSSHSDRNAKVTDVNGDSSIGKFLAGHAYQGVPYSQAVSTGYVGWNISLSEFLTNTKAKNSVFYTSYSDYSKLAPYYGSDCSGFASYAWDLPMRCTCTSMLRYSTYIPYSGLSDLQVGDVLNNPSSHVVVITDVGYDGSGNIVSVEVTEQTPPKMRVTCYGEAIVGRTYNYTGTLKDFQRYFNTGYALYRRSCSSRPNVRRPSDVADLNMAESPSMSVTAAGPSEVTVKLTHKDKNAKIYYTVNGVAPTTSSSLYAKPFTVMASAKATKVTLQAMAVVGGKNSFPLNEELEVAAVPTLAVKGDTSGGGGVYRAEKNGETIYYVKNGSTLTLRAGSETAVYYTTNGDTPTMSSSHSASGAASIAVQKDMVIKAFSVSGDGIPSAVASFKIGLGNMYKITVEDPFGFISPAGDEHMVLQGGMITFRISDSIGSYKLKALKVDGKSVSVEDRDSLVIKNVAKDHTITVEVDTGYTDVKSGAWYGPAVAYTTKAGLFQGTKPQQFSPNDSVTRAMFITVLGRFARPSLTVSGAKVSNWENITAKMGVTQGEDINVRRDASTSSYPVLAVLQASGQYVYVDGEKTTDNVKWYQIQYNSSGSKGYISSVYYGKKLIDVCQFGDITGKNSASVKYAYGYAQWAYLNDIVNGTSATTFNPRGYISRQDVCVMLYNYLTKYLNKNLSTSTNLNAYKDGSKVAGYAQDAVKAMVNIGIIEGKPASGGGKELKPLTATSRAEVATIFMRLDKYLNG